MATSFDTILDIGLTTVDDYSLVQLYNKDPKEFQIFCDGLLVRAIPNFYSCQKTLEYDLSNREFLANFNPIEISILADLWSIEWMTRKVDNSAQFQAKLQNSGSFRNHSEAQNLKEKTSWLDRMRERVYQKITDYQIENISDLDI